MPPAAPAYSSTDQLPPATPHAFLATVARQHFVSAPPEAGNDDVLIARDAVARVMLRSGGELPLGWSENEMDGLARNVSAACEAFGAYLQTVFDDAAEEGGVKGLPNAAAIMRKLRLECLVPFDDATQEAREQASEARS